jgi:Flp pilus assembly protein TadG
MRGLRRRDDSGAAAVEFALILLPLLVILFGLIQYGLYFYSAQTGSNAVNAAARQLAVGNCQAAGSLNTFVNNQLGAAATGTVTVTPVWKKVDGTAAADVTTAGIGGSVTLTISFHSMNLHFPFVPFLNDSVVKRTVQARVEDTTNQGCPS